MTIHQAILLILCILTGLCLWSFATKIAVIKKLNLIQLAEGVCKEQFPTYCFKQIEKALNKHLFIVRFTSACAPFIGLIGTIEGISTGISALGQLGLAAVTEPIAQALLLTGIAVAVATLAFGINQYLSARVDQTLEELSALIHDKLEQQQGPQE